jgi:hypothetical protein
MPASGSRHRAERASEQQPDYHQRRESGIADRMARGGPHVVTSGRVRGVLVIPEESGIFRAVAAHARWEGMGPGDFIHRLQEATPQPW